MDLQVAFLGIKDYSEALALQENLLSLRRMGKIKDTLLLLEHPPVLTIGRRGTFDHILLTEQELMEMGVKLYEVNRGGDVTYHGPGQIVGYPILDLNNYGRDIKMFIGSLEDVFVRLLKQEYGIEAHRETDKYTGVWVGNNKITAIGVAVKHWVTMHGFAFNVNSNLEHFKWIVPCGLTDKGVTSLSNILGRQISMDHLFKTVADYFCKVFACECEPITEDRLYEIGRLLNCI